MFRGQQESGRYIALVVSTTAQKKKRGFLAVVIQEAGAGQHQHFLSNSGIQPQIHKSGALDGVCGVGPQ